MTNKYWMLMVPMLLAGCGGGEVAVQTPAAIAPPPVARSATGLDRVLGRDARALIQIFGTPSQDVREEGARKLQFSGICVLDAYLYPPAKGREPITTYLAARLPDGRDTDKTACVNGLAKR